jgi:hypothetical protein
MPQFAMRQFRPEFLLVENIRTLLSARGIEAQALAMWCGHKPSWISKVMKLERGVQVKDLGKIADFFGLTVAQLFQHGISPLTERRKAERRCGQDRRYGKDRRQERDLNRVHHDVRPFPQRKDPPFSDREYPSPRRSPREIAADSGK